MKRYIPWLLAALVLVVAGTSTVHEMGLDSPVRVLKPGPEPGSRDFDIFVDTVTKDGSPKTQYDITYFDTALGWDFGDRAAYSCAWVEFYSAGVEQFEVHYELTPYIAPPILEIEDHYGIEVHPDSLIGPLCGDGIGPATSMPWDGTDHFPHGTQLDFFLDGQPLVTLDYHREMCSRGYWTPGDEPGEAWLWWDQDGPQSMMPGMDDCTGGPGAPVPVMRAYVKNAGAGVTYCTRDELSGDWCNFTVPTESASMTGASGATP